MRAQRPPELDNVTIVVASHRNDFLVGTAANLGNTFPSEPCTIHKNHVQGDEWIDTIADWFEVKAGSSTNREYVLIVDRALFIRRVSNRFLSLRALRRRLANQVKTVILVGNCSEEDRTLAIRNGARAVLPNEFQPHQLSEAVLTAIWQEREMASKARLKKLAAIGVFAFGVLGFLLGTIVTSIAPALTFNLLPKWHATPCCVAGPQKDGRVPYEFQIVNDGKTPITGIVVDGLSGNVRFEGIGLRHYIDKVDPGRVGTVAFTVRPREEAPSAGQENEIWLDVNGPGRCQRVQVPFEPLRVRSQSPPRPAPRLPGSDPSGVAAQ